jgi:hypothetical protein
MIVAMRIVMTVHVSRNDIIGVGGMRNGFVTAAFCVFVGRLVPPARMPSRTSFWINCRSFYHMFVDMAVVCEVQVAVVEIIGMSGVPDLGVRACGAMLVRVPAVRRVFHAQSIP